MHSCDVLPTFLDAAGLAKPEEMDEESMLDILRGRKWRTILDLEHSQIYEPDNNAWVSLTDGGGYKYIHFTLTDQQQLFDPLNDPYELTDLTGEQQHESLVNEWRKKS